MGSSKGPKERVDSFQRESNQARKRHININFFVRLVPVFTGFVPGTNPVCPWDKSGEKQGQTQEFSLFYTVEARFHRVCPWDKPGLSQGQTRGRRAAQKVYVKKVYVPFSLATKVATKGQHHFRNFQIFSGRSRTELHRYFRPRRSLGNRKFFKRGLK